jgi:hypothetical protein
MKVTIESGKPVKFSSLSEGDGFLYRKGVIGIKVLKVPPELFNAFLFSTSPGHGPDTALILDDSMVIPMAVEITAREI